MDKNQFVNAVFTAISELATLQVSFTTVNRTYFAGATSDKLMAVVTLDCSTIDVSSLDPLFVYGLKVHLSFEGSKLVLSVYHPKYEIK